MWFLLFAFVLWAEPVVISMNYEQPERCPKPQCPCRSRCKPQCPCRSPIHCRSCPKCPVISANGRCRSGWTYYKNTNACYKTFLWASFDDAERRCVSYGGHLTSIHSDDENAFVVEMAQTGIKQRFSQGKDFNMLTWIGLRQADHPRSKKWTWTDGTNVDFIAWDRNEPNNELGIERCAQVYSDHSDKGKDPFRKWNDIPCSPTMRAYVCKKMAKY